MYICMDSAHNTWKQSSIAIKTPDRISKQFYREIEPCDEVQDHIDSNLKSFYQRSK